MSREYDSYLREHAKNVALGFYWIQTYLPELIKKDEVAWTKYDYEWAIAMAHDATKKEPSEYKAYDDYFYGNKQDPEVIKAFNYAWLHHIHWNQHHWQHWVLHHDNAVEGVEALDMPYPYILEMICDWWSFSWQNQDFKSITRWYDDNKDHIILSPKTRETVEEILSKIMNKVDALAAADAEWAN